MRTDSDAIGAIGIGRTFCFGGAKKNPMHDPTIPPNINLTREEYQAAHNPGMVNTTINHFHEKLLKLKDMMKTERYEYGTKKARSYGKVFERFPRRMGGALVDVLLMLLFVCIY